MAGTNNEESSHNYISHMTIDALPPEILHMILQLLPANERLRAERVRRRWRHTVQRAWTDIKVIEMINSTTLNAYTKTTDFVNLHDFAGIVKDTLYIATNDEKIIDCLVSKVKFSIETVNHDRFGSKTLEQILRSVAKYCRNIKSISLTEVEPGHADILAKLCRNNSKLQWIEMDFMDMAQLLPVKNLKKLGFSFAKFNPICEKNIVSLINKSERTIKEIDLNYNSPDIMMAVSKCQNLEVLKFDVFDNPPSSVLLIYNISILNALTGLSISARKFDYNFLIKVLQQCKNLKDLSIWCPDITLPDSIEEPVLPLPQLQTLELRGTTIPEEMLIRRIKFKHLKLDPLAQILFDIVLNDDLEILELGLDLTIWSPIELIEEIVAGTRDGQKNLKLIVPKYLYERASVICTNSKVHPVIETYMR